MTKFVGGLTAEQLPEGLYELLKTDALASRLGQVADLQPKFADVEDEEAPDILSRHVANAVRQALSTAKPADRVALANRLLQELNTPDRIADGPTQLQSLHRPDFLKRRQLRRPTTKLSDSALLTNSKDDPNLAAELRAEIESANTVDLLCAFVRWTGLRLLQQFFDGRTASELRLWDALDADLLVPFHYFGVSDDVDLSQLEWKRGNYDTAQLNNL